jgi:hypothetical protein
MKKSFKKKQLATTMKQLGIALDFFVVKQP